MWENLSGILLLMQAYRGNAQQLIFFKANQKRQVRKLWQEFRCCQTVFYVSFRLLSKDWRQLGPHFYILPQKSTQTSDLENQRVKCCCKAKYTAFQLRIVTLAKIFLLMRRRLAREMLCFQNVSSLVASHLECRTHFFMHIVSECLPLTFSSFEYNHNTVRKVFHRKKYLITFNWPKGLLAIGQFKSHTSPFSPNFLGI